MLTRKEELFVKPFQQRLYHQHKVKVSSSNNCPLYWLPSAYHNIILLCIWTWNVPLSLPLQSPHILVIMNIFSLNKYIYFLHIIIVWKIGSFSSLVLPIYMGIYRLSFTWTGGFRNNLVNARIGLKKFCEY